MVTWGVTDAGDGLDGASGDSGAGNVQCPTALLDQLHSYRERTDRPIPEPTVACYTGRTDRLVVRGSDVTVAALEYDAQYQPSTACELPDGEFLLSTTGEGTDDCDRDDPLVSDERRVYVRFPGPASLRPTEDGVELSLWESAPVTIGVRRASETGLGRIQVPATPSGLATGISHLSAAHHTAAPSRSHPELRDHPPLLTTGETTAIPESVRDKRPETGIELRLPDSVPELFVTAPLAYYLGASVTVGDRETPLLAADGTTVELEFSGLPELQTEVADLLRRVFYLDCLVRRVDPDESDQGLRSALSFDPEAVRSLTPAGRLERYVEAPADVVRAALPDWHLSTYARPSTERARCLPFLLDKLSLVYLPESSTLDRGDLLERTLADAFPTRGAARTHSEVLDPNLQAGRLHAWLAPGTPIDAFKTTPTAYENRYRFRDRQTERLRVSVVLNDDEMADEHTAVTEIYRAADLPMDVFVDERLTTDELADVFKAQNEPARRRIVMSKDYAVVGDGTYALLPTPSQPAVLWLSETAAGYDLTCEVVTAQGAGENYWLPFGDRETLNGRRTELSMTQEELVDILSTTSMPVIYDGEFHWSDDLAARLDTGF